MCAWSLNERSAGSDDPLVRDGVATCALLAVSTVLVWLTMRVEETIVGVFVRALGERRTGAVVYTVLALVALAAVYLVVNRYTDRGVDLNRIDAVELVGTAALICLVGAYVLHGAVDLPLVPGDLLGSLVSVGVTMALPAVVYARLRGISLGFDLPDRQGRALALTYGLVALVVSLGSVAVIANTGGLSTPLVAEFLDDSQLTLGRLLLGVLVPGALTGLGTAILYHGAIYTGLADTVSPVSVVAGVTALIGVDPWGSFVVRLATGSVQSGLGTDFGTVDIGFAVAGVVLAVVVAILTVAGCEALRRRFAGADSLRAGALVGLVVAVGPLVALTPTAHVEVGSVLSSLGLGLVAALATVGYQRTHSVWVPALLFAIHGIVLNRELAPVLAGLLR